MAITANEQYLIELINRARLDPLGEAARYGLSDLNDGLAAGTLNATPKQVLAPNTFIEAAAQAHSAWMLSADTFSHTGAAGSSSTDRIRDAGYTLTSPWSTGENIAWQGTTGTIDLGASILAHHEGLFLSAGHRANLLDDGFREIGVAQVQGFFTQSGTAYSSSMLTENFATSGRTVVVTGVAYTDSDGDEFYSVGEGTGGVSLSSGGASASTAAAGGYSLGVSSSAATEVTITAAGSTSVVRVDTSDGNAKLDILGGTFLKSATSLTLVSGIADAALLGLAGASLTGGAGANVLYGNAGNNHLAGGAGNDVLVGGDGIDTAVFGIAAGSATVTQSGSALTVSSSEGTDTLRGIERFEFSDGLFTVEDMLEGGPVEGMVLSGSDEADELTGGNGDDEISGNGGDDTLMAGGGADHVTGDDGDDTIHGGDGPDTLNGGAGNDTIYGGETVADLRDVIYGGEGDDFIDAGYGNDQVFGMGGADTIAGGFGADTLQGQDGDDVITGSALSDLVYGGAGNDFVNGGFGFDRINGGAGADKFYHLGVADHGSDWIQDYSSGEGDVLLFGNAAASADDFRVTFVETASAGTAGVEEAFVIYRPTGQIMWALIDGGGEAEINIEIDGTVFDLLI
ncbi:Ca2+-binding RTX toxin-like protein [Rhodovulum iodosum]|uniref:Ca2+-binding RTX toxin-like protein n=1 Tax=Rhodovulum iodosum TaxID=68291 RepID=A0ABV3XUI8_9RHOB|nr:CAP domain-containing protein [Rhodovulum robiginosum]RSK39043.1 hypothetical protein EJA01_01530 [Rhodovulum robiginosum]